MADRIFLVCAYGFEYDDSHYYQPESGGSDALRGYLTEEKAVADARSRNIAELRDHFEVDELQEWVSDGEWGAFAPDREALLKLFSEYGVEATSKDCVSYEVPSERLPDAFFERLYDVCTLQWFTVTSIELDDG